MSFKCISSSLCLFSCLPRSLSQQVSCWPSWAFTLLQEQVQITAGHWAGWKVYSWFEREMVALETLEALVFLSQLLKYAT